MNRSEYWAKCRSLAQAEYAKLELLDETYWSGRQGARWLIGTPKSSIFLTEIIAGACGSLVVHGDIELARFAYDKDDAWRRLLWMACRPPSEYTYEKYRIGMGSLEEPSACFDRKVAANDMESMIQDLREEEDPDRLPLIEAIRGARGHLDTCYTTRDVLDRVEAELPDSDSDLYEWGVGAVPPLAMFFAHAAMERTMLLLWGKYGVDGPRERQLRTDSPPGQSSGKGFDPWYR